MSSSSGSMRNRDDWQGLDMRNYTLYVKFNALIVGTIFVCGLLAASLFLYSTSTYMNYELDTSGRELAASISQVISNSVASSFENAFSIPPLYTTIGLTAIAAVIVLRKNATVKVLDLLVPVMAVCYFLITLFIIFTNIVNTFNLCKLINY